MDTAALRRTLWDGAIPCRIELDPSECRVFDAASPYFVSAVPQPPPALPI